MNLGTERVRHKDGKIVLMHRILPDMQILIADELQIPCQSIGETFMTPRPWTWDGEKIGGGAPPLKTRYGWLQFYHGAGEREGRRAYRLGVALSALDDPKQILYRSWEPVLEPGDEDETADETHYQQKGWVSDVVFTCGAVPKHKNSDDLLSEADEILVYYGVADEVLCVAEVKLADIVPNEVGHHPFFAKDDPSPSSGRLKRFSGNPILKPNPEAVIFEKGREVRWERLTYNAGAIRLDGKVYLFYRALGYDGISRIGLAWSRDGLKVEGRLPYPIFYPKGRYERPEDERERRERHLKKYKMCREIGGVEDPRVTLIGDTLHMTYTAYSDIPRLALAAMKVDKFLQAVQKGCSFEEWQNRWQRLGLIFPWEDKDGFLFAL